MKTIKSLVPAALAFALSACGTTHLSTGITPEGWVNGDVVWPNKDSATLKDGTFPNPSGLKQLSNGVTRDQLYELIGRPHFREGTFNVREWDYVFHFRGTKGTFITCQYKIIFSANDRAESFFSYPEACAPALEDFEVTPEEADAIRTGIVTVSGDDPAAYGGVGSRSELSADALFEFDSAVVTPAGLARLLQLASAIKADGLDRITVEGHTDRLGTDAYNLDLSQRRADAVRDVLLAAGVAHVAKVEAFGRTAPRVQCVERERAALIDCLAPNRRVVVIARK